MATVSHKTLGNERDFGEQLSTVLLLFSSGHLSCPQICLGVNTMCDCIGERTICRGLFVWEPRFSVFDTVGSGLVLRQENVTDSSTHSGQKELGTRCHF